MRKARQDSQPSCSCLPHHLTCLICVHLCSSVANSSSSSTESLLLLGGRSLLGGAGGLLHRFLAVHALLLVRCPHRDQTAVRSGHRALDQQQVVVCVDSHHAQIADGHLRVAVLAGHADALLG